MRTHNRENMPEWARRVDEFGPRRWHRETENRNRRAECISNIIVNLMGVVILYKIPDWHFGFITEKYATLMYILILSGIVRIAGNLIILFFNYPATRYALNIPMEIVSFIAMISFYYLYPLDFSNSPGLTWLDIILPWMLIIGMVVSAVKVFSNTWKLIFWR